MNADQKADQSAASPRVQFYGRRKSRPLRPARAAALDRLETCRLPQTGNIDPHSLFSGVSAYWLDIGFGNGEILAEWVQAKPDTGFVGIEPFVNGVSAFLKKLGDNTLSEPALPPNIKVHMDMAETAVPRFSDKTFDVVSLLNPDPWPKARHAKRRFVRLQNVQMLARVLKPGGLFFTCTDSPDLAEYMAVEIVQSGLFTFSARSPDDWHTPPPFWSPTRYAVKDMAQSGRMFFLSFTKN